MKESSRLREYGKTHISPKGINRGGFLQNHAAVDCVTWRFMMLTARKDGQTWRRYSQW